MSNTSFGRNSASIGNSFLSVSEEPRKLDPGMGVAVGRRTVFRTEDEECFGKVADRVAAGNMSLLGELDEARKDEQMRLRNAIATGALLTSGRHLQHGDMGQKDRNIEVVSNCSTSITSFVKFYLLLNGSGVGRSYDDDLMVVDWANAPSVFFFIEPTHKDWDAFPKEMKDEICSVQEIGDINHLGFSKVIYHKIGDSREGWAKALELLESMAYNDEWAAAVILDFSLVRPAGAPIAGMQNRPASGPVSLMRAFWNLNKIIEKARVEDTPLWEQAMRIDHHFSVEVQVGGARRAARATKNWRDPGIFDFIKIKSEGGLWSANNSVTVDAEFWDLARPNNPSSDTMVVWAQKVFSEITRCAYINGEPGFLNGDKLEDHRTGSDREKPIYHDGRDVRSKKYQATYSVKLLSELNKKAYTNQYSTTVNPCYEICLHVTGGYCVISDFAPLLACPWDINDIHNCPSELIDVWDQRVADSIKLGVRFLMRVNTMDALYGEEVKRTNRMGIGPTGLHEWAWTRFGLTFNDLVNDPYGKAAPFWSMLNYLSDLAKKESNNYAQELKMNRPLTISTTKPSGSVSKIFGLTEGAHLPARRQYLRWVQFKGQKNPDGSWEDFSDPLLAEYEERGYPIKELKTFPGMSVVGFPTIPLMLRIAPPEAVTTAPEASPRDQYKWLQLLEKHWIGEEQGNQVSYTMKIDTSLHSLEEFRQIVLEEQPKIRCCAILPSKPDSELGYEYTPEEDVSEAQFNEILKGIDLASNKEDIDMESLRCSSGACPL